MIKRLRVLRRSTMPRVAGMTQLTAELCLKHFFDCKTNTSGTRSRKRLPRILLEGIGGPARAGRDILGGNRPRCS